jgi:hypothetical protein
VNEPLSAKIDLVEDLRDNNPVRAAIMEQRSTALKQAALQERQHLDLKRAIEEVRDSLLPDANKQYDEYEQSLGREKSRQKRAHEDVINARKRMKKGDLSVEEFRETEKEEEAINKEVGRWRSTLTRSVKKYVRDFEKGLEHRGQKVLKVNETCGSDNPFDLTVITFAHGPFRA